MQNALAASRQVDELQPLFEELKVEGVPKGSAILGSPRVSSTKVWETLLESPSSVERVRGLDTLGGDSESGSFWGMDTLSPLFGSLPPFEVEIFPSMTKKKKKYIKWTLEETNALIKGVVEHGEGQWQVIRDSNPILEKKRRTQLKDKYRNLKNAGKHFLAAPDDREK